MLGLTSFRFCHFDTSHFRVFLQKSMANYLEVEKRMGTHDFRGKRCHYEEDALSWNDISNVIGI